ncbi:2-polyprenyl-6-methoxyphenol hydroxylase-like FAD-dependent oxidoreductase [Arthrobacter ginsengisoli]|uniref:2-polyprenyl-6-methoxyphenol hydroxylase-like FAD-dependent oxidoreductase n=1 Tax=Arthrobacter ginsengisoli TaxID=1356565 RepID=A0ABU1U6S9_9MICC|nr:NAD(P)/FAD-dependent oxidoreductase [Arthrobacter ginsengisoli]MDR7080830.1 2-polyprenyl-6-methoxyphenol hydroxylase-like FAD-dependent oxidoreductase [Arthrobacter ginsengisoli]
MADVLVIGGGPVGLFMAALLLQHGVSVRILEQRTGAEPHSRAIGIHPPSLDALQGIGVAPDLVAEGVPIRRGIALGGGSRLAEMSFAGVSDRFPFVLALPQSRTEAILEERVRQLDPGAMRRGVRVTRLHHDGGQVTAETGTGGPAARYTAAIAIAADGVRSTVRARLGTPVRAKDYPDSYLMGDFADTTGFGPDAALFLESAGIVESFPLPGKLRRWVVRLADAAGVGDPGSGTDARWLVQRIGERTGIDVDPGSNSMLSRFGVRSRLARRMVTGRTVLIGDAAHEISPIGGQGMNLGWLDAVALAPVILASLRGEDMGMKIRNFEIGRQAAAARAARQSEINMALGRPLPAAAWSMRNRAIAAAAAVPAVNGFVARRFTMQ